LGSDFEENFYMSDSGRRLADAEAPAVTYNVIALKEGVEQYRTVGTGFLYADPAWANLDKGDYQYSVEAVYLNGQKADIQSKMITKTTPSAISTRQTGASVKLDGTTLLVDAEAVQVFSSNGNQVAGGTGINRLDTAEWPAGIYIVRTLKHGEWSTNKVRISGK